MSRVQPSRGGHAPPHPLRVFEVYWHCRAAGYRKPAFASI